MFISGVHLLALCIQYQELDQWQVEYGKYITIKGVSFEDKMVLCVALKSTEYASFEMIKMDWSTLLEKGIDIERVIDCFMQGGDWFGVYDQSGFLMTLHK